MAAAASLPAAETRIPFTRNRFLCIGASLAMIVLSAIMLSVRGLNLGIDFVGGSVIEFQTEAAPDLAAIRGAVGALGLGETQLQTFGSPTDLVVRIVKQPGTGLEAEQAQQAAAQKVVEALRATIPGVTIKRTETVGGIVSGELLRAGVLALLLAVGLMQAYVWFRFDSWQFGVGAVLALIHDVAIVIGVFELTRMEFNLTIIAAILTVIGYSMNDTVVVYDRIRENLRKYKKMGLAELIDMSVNQTLSRTLMTSFTTLIAVAALFILGGESLRGFSFAIIVGILIGTYSSIYVAAPVLMFTGVRFDIYDAKADET